MYQYSVSYSLFSQNRFLSGKDASPADSSDSALEILNSLQVGDDLHVTILPKEDRLLFQMDEDGVYVELDFSNGGYLAKTMSQDLAKEVLENHQKYFDDPEGHGFERTVFS